jgi:hypothetical protein
MSCKLTLMPFNHIDDECEYRNVLLHFFHDVPVLNLFSLDTRQLSLLANTKLINNEDIDPDMHAFNHLDINCKYLSPVDVKQTLTEKFKNHDILAVLHLNARSLVPKLTQLHLLLTQLDIEFDIIAISETWESESNKSMVHIPGYSKISSYRTDGRSGGGVALFIKDGLLYTEVKDIKTSTFESTFIKITGLAKVTTIIGAIYRPPNTDLQKFNNEFESVLHKIVTKKSKCIIAGDYNINLLNHSIDSETECFLNTLYTNTILPMIKLPTRYGNHGATLIDNIISNKSDANQMSGVILTDISDHLPVFYITGNSKLTKKSKDIYKQVRMINNENILNLNLELGNMAWPDLANMDVNTAYNSFYDKFNTLYNKNLPVKIKKIKIYQNKYKPWLTHGILVSVKKKDNLYKKYIAKRTPESKINYTRYKNKLTKIIRNSEKNYYTNRFNALQGNIKDTWKLINNVLHDCTENNTNTFISDILINGKLENNPRLIADKFNDYFTNVGPDLAKKISPSGNNTIYDTMPEPNNNSMFIEPCTRQEIITVVNNLSNSKGLGLDGLSVKVVKSIISNIASPLLEIFNNSFQYGIFPDKLKKAKITPIFKNEDKLLVNNYRPISVLPIFSKILEKIMHRRLTSFINKHSIMSNNQYGFRETYSTHLALLTLIDQISKKNG